MTPGPVDWPTRDLLAVRAGTTPDRTALVDADAGERFTYRELDARVSGVTARLENHVHGPGVRAGVLVDTRVAFVEVLFAAMRRAVTLVPLSVRLTPAELRPRIERADLDLLVCEAATEDRAVEATTEGRAVEAAGCPVVSVDEPARDEVGSLRPVADAHAVSTPIEPDWTQLVVFTSGTTGEPKGVRLTARNLVASAAASAFRLGVLPGDRWLVCLPAYHVGGLAPAVRAALYGTAVVVQREFDPEATARVVADHDATGVSLVPTMLARLLDAGWSPPDSLRVVLVGGAPASRALLDRCAEAGVPACPTYGATETASQVATARPGEAAAHPGTVGQPLLGTRVSVLDEEGRRCDPGETGELVVDGPTVSPGYLDDDRTGAAFSGRGFHTGDLGYRDGDGRLRVVGRLDDRIGTGGENVDPAEVAAVLRESPAVEDAAVVGLPDEEWGERVAALVVPAPGADPDPGDVLAHCEGRLAGYKHPRTVGFADALPRTASGTVDREAVEATLRRDGE